MSKSWSKKIYVAYHPDPMPHLMVTGLVGPGRNNTVDMTEFAGLGYSRDEIGWYHVIGELEISYE